MPSIQYTKSVTHNIYSDESLTDIMNEIISNMLSLGLDGDLSQVVSNLNNLDESAILDQTTGQDLTQVDENIPGLNNPDNMNNADATAIANFIQSMSSYDNGNNLNAQDIVQNDPMSDSSVVSDATSNADNLLNDQQTPDVVTDVAPEMPTDVVPTDVAPTDVAPSVPTDVPVAPVNTPQDVASALPASSPVVPTNVTPTVPTDVPVAPVNTPQDVASTLPASAPTVPTDAPVAPAMPTAPVSAPTITPETLDNGYPHAGLPILTPIDQTHELVAPMSSLI